ncbi:DNA phosphorothioation system sulfurtransferase DndC, partial [bacterium]|nr:DNA phosphorothioation system sulfurtransferase DndC [bacterium]
MSSANKSAFAEAPIHEVVEELLEEIRALYTLDEIPWVIGYSGGKDSTAVLQLVWMAIAGLEEAQRQKPVHVISTDTLVENPIVARWVSNSLVKMGEAAEAAGLPIHPNRLTPTVRNSFWVNLMG